MLFNKKFEDKVYLKIECYQSKSETSKGWKMKYLLPEIIGIFPVNEAVAWRCLRFFCKTNTNGCFWAFLTPQCEWYNVVKIGISLVNPQLPRKKFTEERTGPTSFCLLIETNRNTRKRCDTSLKLTIKTAERRHVSDVVLMSLLLTLNIFNTFS